MKHAVRSLACLLAMAWTSSCTSNEQPERPPSPAQPQSAAPAPAPVVVVNDVHSQLNATTVDRVAKPESTAAVQQVIREAAAEHKAVSIAGGRHAMGGQQFGAGTILIDASSLDHVLRLDSEAGIVTVQAGIQWPELITYLEREQSGKWPQWGIRQKQTGADRLSIGGALSANAHGRGLRFKPMVDDVESFTLVDADARVLKCSRLENVELFKLAIGDTDSLA